jgi:Leucine-rich repeat (LRR) protein
MELNCIFTDQSWLMSNHNIIRYTCEITDASITQSGTEISRCIGEHLPNRTNNYVTAIRFEETTVHYFPQGVHNIFPNLKALEISGTGLKEISREDLIGLENIEDLVLDNNQLTSLPSDLFAEMKSLKEISIFHNKLEFISSKLLEPIVGNELTYVDLRANPSINAIFWPENEGSVESVEELMGLMDEDSKIDEFYQVIATCFKDLWTSKRFADFTIIGGFDGSSKEFAVHKIVLATHSSVFTAIFENDMKETQTGKMVIDDFSADTVEGMLRFMYTGEVTNMNAMDLFAIASKYDVAGLKKRTEKIIFRNLDESNALEVFGLGHLYDSVHLKRAAFISIKQMFPNRKLDYELLQQPGGLQQLIEVHRKFQEVEAELDSTLMKFEKVDE